MDDGSAESESVAVYLLPEFRSNISHQTLDSSPPGASKFSTFFLLPTRLRFFTFRLKNKANILRIFVLIIIEVPSVIHGFTADAEKDLHA